MIKGLDRDQWTMLIILSAINFLNYLDRQVIFPLFANIKLEFGLSDYQLGLLGSVFVLVFSLVTIPMGIAADKYSRKLVITLGVLFWSVATFLSGIAKSFTSLLHYRALVGVGEASYSPAASALMADNFPPAQRASVQGIFHLGAFVGGCIGAMIGGLVVYYTGSWRQAFFIVSIPGALLALSIFLIKDKSHKHVTPKLSFKPIFKNSAFAYVILSGIFSSFTAGGYLSWGVEYINRYTALNLRDASIYLGIAMLVAGSLGVLLGSHLSDLWQKHSPDGRSMLVATSSILAAFFLLLGFNSTGTGFGFFVYFMIGIALMSFYLGPAVAVIHDVTEPKMRASAIAIYLFSIHLLGDTLSPAITGLLSDLYGLKTSLMLVTAGVTLAGLAFLGTAHVIKNRRVELWD